MKLNQTEPPNIKRIGDTIDLARESSVGVNTIRRTEVAENGTSLTTANELAIRRALEAAGVEFIDENGGGPGVRLRKLPQGRQRK